MDVNRPLGAEFAALIASAKWDVCLLQEAPPYWDAALARATGAASYVALTSRNWLAPVRARLARWNPDLMGSWEGGSNITLVRPPLRIVDPPRSLLLNPLPQRGLRERRRMSFVRAQDSERDVAIANLHLTAGSPPNAEREALYGAATAHGWAGEEMPLILGGDFNLRPKHAALFEQLEHEHGLTGVTAPDAIDHILARGLDVVQPATRWAVERRELEVPKGLETRRLRLSDHAPVEATFGVR